MIFRSACPTAALAAWCRALQHGLGVGFTPGKVLRQQAKSGPAALREVALRLADRLDTGDSLSDALQPEVGRFPILFVESVAVGEQTGRLSDILGELETHYTNLQQARNRFFVSLIWPAISLGGAIITLTLLIWISDMLLPGMDPLGIGLTGAKGALIFFVISSGIVLGCIGMLHTIANDEALKSRVLGFCLNVPGLANCVRAFALQRFSLAFHFLSEAGMKADRTMAVALRATANRAYRDHESTAPKKLRKGGEFHDVLAECGPKLFPEEYLEVARIGEETGQMPELMRKQAAHYQTEGERKLRMLTAVAGYLIYGMVALLILVAIVRLLTTTVTPALDPYQNEDLKALEKMAGY